MIFAHNKKCQIVLWKGSYLYNGDDLNWKDVLMRHVLESKMRSNLSMRRGVYSMKRDDLFSKRVTHILEIITTSWKICLLPYLHLRNIIKLLDNNESIWIFRSAQAFLCILVTSKQVIVSKCKCCIMHRAANLLRLSKIIFHLVSDFAIFFNLIRLLQRMIDSGITVTIHLIP